MPAIVAVRDSNGALGIAWRSILANTTDQVTAAPALDEASETLVVSTVGNIYVFKNVAGLTSNVPAPAPLGPPTQWHDGQEMVSGPPKSPA